MKAKLLFILLALSLNTNVFAQSEDYFSGKRMYCEMKDSESKKLYDLGIECIMRNQYLGAANNIFRDLIKKDSTSCDAWFFAGYTYRLNDMHKEAVVMYYMADSLAHNRSIEFKINLAYSSMRIGAMDLSRKKYVEITKFFPHSPEGYYGIAVTSLIIGDIEYGLKNINIAEDRYQEDPTDTQMLKAVLLTMNGQHEASLPYYEKVKSKYSKSDDVNGNYALSLHEVATLKNDEKMMKKAKKHYEKVKDKTKLSEEMKAKFEKK